MLKWCGNGLANRQEIRNLTSKVIDMYVHANLHFIAEKVFTLMSDLLPYRDLGCHFPEFVCQ